MSRLKERPPAPSPQPVHLTSAPSASHQGKHTPHKHTTHKPHTPHTHLTNTLHTPHVSLHLITHAYAALLLCTNILHKPCAVTCPLTSPAAALMPVSMATASPQPVMPVAGHGFQVRSVLYLYPNLLFTSRANCSEGVSPMNA